MQCVEQLLGFRLTTPASPKIFVARFRRKHVRIDTAAPDLDVLDAAGLEHTTSALTGAKHHITLRVQVA